MLQIVCCTLRERVPKDDVVPGRVAHNQRVLFDLPTLALPCALHEHCKSHLSIACCSCIREAWHDRHVSLDMHVLTHKPQSLAKHKVATQAQPQGGCTWVTNRAAW